MLGTNLLGTQLLQGPTGFVSYEQTGISLSLQQQVHTEQSGTRAELQQNVYTEQSGPQAQLQQVVHAEQLALQMQLSQSVVGGGGITLQLQQSVIGNQPPRRLKLQQMVLALSGSQTRVDWTLIITVDSVQMPKIAAEQDVRIYAEDSKARTAGWTVINDPGPIYLHTWAGKSVTIDYVSDEDDSGAVEVHRLFTGWISKAEYSHDRTRTTFTATDRRRERLNAMTRDQLASQIGGHWSPHVFAEDAEPADYARDRMKTVPASLNFDRNGTMRVTGYAPKATPDYTLGNNQVHYKQVSFRFATREDVRNTSQVELRYRYSILRHRERSYRWNFPYTAAGWRDQMLNPIDLTPREIISGAIAGTGWDLAAISWTPLPPAAVYYINGIPYVWNPIKAASVTYVYERDANGDIVPDADGQPKVAEVKVNSRSDPTGLYCIGASWRMATRWAQTVTETYTVTVSAPQSVDQYGEVSAGSRGYGCESEYDDRAWEDLEGYISPSAAHRDVVISDGGRGGAWYDPPLTQSANGDWIWVTDENRDEFEEAARCAIAAARVEILDAHRRNYVDCVVKWRGWRHSMPLLPIDLHHTVEIDTDAVVGTGRAYSLETTFNHLKRTRITNLRLAFSQVYSSEVVSDSPVVAPTAPSNADQPYSPGTITLGNHVGNQRYSPPYSESWTGLITNYRYRDTSAEVEVYPHGFIVDTEAAESRDRDERELVASQTYQVEIPHDDLQIYKVA